MESEFLEYKSSLAERREIVESVAAFASSKGGEVRVGVAPNGDMVGLNIGSGTIESLVNEIKTNTDPRQHPSIEELSQDGKAILVIRVSESPLKPVYAYGVPFQRVGRSNQKLDSTTAFTLREGSTGRTWDGLTSLGVTTSDLGKQSILDFYERSGSTGSKQPDAVLRSLGLVVGDRIANAGVLLFGENPQNHLPTAVVKCLVQKAGRLMSPQSIEGDVINQVEATLQFLRTHLSEEVVIGGSAERRFLYPYPEVALREAIINAVCHRDYASPGAIQVRVFEDKLEIWNPGGLPSELTVEDLYRDHPSRPRNPKLARALDKIGFVEQWGSGTLRMIRETESAGQPPPEFDSSMDTFIVRFWASDSAHPHLRSLSERQHFMFSIIKDRGNASTSQLAEILSISRRLVQLDLHRLMELGMIQLIGRGPGAHYRVSPRWSIGEAKGIE